MATDYDAPRRNEADELGEDSLEELKARRAEAQSSSVDVDETDFNENLELPGRGPVQRGAHRPRAAQAGGRVHLLALLPGAPPQPAGDDPQRPAGLPRLRAEGPRCPPPRRPARALSGAVPDVTEGNRPRSSRGTCRRPRPVGGTVGRGRRRGHRARVAARALADAVAGLLGRDTPAGQPAGARRAAAGARAAAGVLADVVGAVAAAARSAADPRPGTGPAGGAGSRGWAPGGLLTDLLDAAAPRLPIRDRDRLRRAYPGASDAEIADALVARATRLTGGIGAATGGLAAAQWFAPPSLVAVPLEMGAQTVLVAAVEVVLVGELHELAGRPPR